MHSYRQPHTHAALPPMKRQFSQWEPLSKILDRLEDEDLLFLDHNGNQRASRAVLVDFLNWCLKDGVEVGTDAASGEIMIRAPYKD